MGYFGRSGTAPPTPPAGASGQVQFNDGGAFGADAGLAFDKAAQALAVGGNVRAHGALVTAKTSAPAAAELANGEVAIWFDAVGASLRFLAKTTNGTVVAGVLQATVIA